jgi:hypothetical protein
MFLCCVVLCRHRPLRPADLSSRGILQRVLTRLRNFRCEAAKVLTRTCRDLDDDDYDDDDESLIIQAYTGHTYSN